MKAKHTGDLPKRRMTYGPKLLLPFEEQNGRASFVLMYTDCDEQEPGTCGTRTRQCATCCVPPPPSITPALARVLLDILLRYDDGQGPLAGNVLAVEQRREPPTVTRP